jgi:hypothetical protein
MNDNGTGPSNLVDTTDCLEAVGALKWWKNILFAILVLCLLLQQGLFWLVNSGYVRTDEQPACAAIQSKAGQVAGGANLPASAGKQGGIELAAKQVAAEPNAPAAPAQAEQKPVKFKIELKWAALSIRLLNFALIVAAALYCLTLLFCVKVSLLARLGGINHICRAFFRSLVFFVFLLPWQKCFDEIIIGEIFTMQELLCRHAAHCQANILGAALYYLRFTGYWLFVLLVLVFSYIRSIRWAKAILRRLELV